MNKKIISAALAATMMLSMAAIAASAAEVDDETTGASVTFVPSGEGERGTVKFDMGDTWDHGDRILFYMWAEKEGEKNMGCTAGEWGGDPVWGTKKNTCSKVEGEDGVVESYEFEMPGDDWNVFLIFHDLTTGAQTCDCILTANALGKTAVLTGETFENSQDSEKRDLDVVIDGADDCGAHKLITSTGHVVGHAMAPNEDGAYTVARYVISRIGVQDKNGELCVTEDKVATAISEFGTNADDVWAKFQEFEGREGYEDYADKVEEAKKMINPSAANADTDSATDSDKKDTDSAKDDNGDSTTSSKSSTTSSTSSTSTTTKTTTKTTTTTGTTSTAATVEAGAETGDTTGTAVFAAVLFGAAVTMFLARKKED